MMNNDKFPKNCRECDKSEGCKSAAYGVGTCKYRHMIEAANIVAFLGLVGESEERVKPNVKAHFDEDVVREPDHYKQGSFEVIDEMVIVFGIENTIQFCRMNAWKYRARASYKGNAKQDMAKANRYLEMAAELEAIKNGKGKLELLMGDVFHAEA